MGNLYSKMMAGNICSKVCSACQNKESCWRDGGEATKTVDEFSKNNLPLVNSVSLPSYFRNKCHRTESFAVALKNSTELVKTEKQWLSKLNEARKLMGSQLKLISHTIDAECESITKFRDIELEKKIYTEFDILNTKVTDVFAKTYGERFEAEISFLHSNVFKDSKKICIEALTKATGGNVSFAGFSKSGTETVMKFTSPPTFSATFGYASKPKSGEKVSGDSFNVIYTGDESAVMALSDGMGSGEKANEESKFVIEMLKSFLQAGFDSKSATEIINSSLLLKGEKDSFATLDLCNINLSDATLLFTRLGASSAYIKTDEKCIKLKGTSLPLGVMKNESGEKYMMPIDSDLTIVLMSDGIGDISLKNPSLEGWIEKELLSTNSKNPQIIASKLLQSAVNFSNKNVKDDMTVLVGCITKN